MHAVNVLPSMADSASILNRFKKLYPLQVDLSLTRMLRLMTALGSPERRLPQTIHVAGTNGKGSTIAFLRSILEAAGKRVHVYTSPHLIDLRERIRLAAPGGGELVSADGLYEALRTCELANAGAPITVFEALTAAAFSLFASRPADVLLLEVGLGGRLDATNVIPNAAASVLTPISLDHMEFLGDSVERIAAEKAGIFRTSCPVIVSSQRSIVLRILEEKAQSMGTSIHALGKAFSVVRMGDRLNYRDGGGKLELPPPGLTGDHQIVNAATAVAAARTVFPDLPVSAIQYGIRHAEWPGRLERVAAGQLIAIAPPCAELWLDGAHNEDGARALAAAIKAFSASDNRPTVLIYGSLWSKNTRAFLSAVSGVTSEIVAVPVDVEQEIYTVNDIARFASEQGIISSSADGLKQSLHLLSRRAWEVPPRIIVTGSLYLVGAARTLNGNIAA
jgi:dihydrofolate synthase / folylpolyglutamate synthase